MKKKCNHSINQYNNQHHKFLIELPKISQKIEYFKTLYTPKEFFNELLYVITHANHHIYLITLYLENDQGGKKVLDTLLKIKSLRPQIKIKILIDWYRAKRNRIGKSLSITKKNNIDWYRSILQQRLNTEIFIYSVPINTNEALGVLHLKGSIIDNTILYTGASINNEYLHIYNKYRYDRYHIIQNKELSKIMIKYIDEELLSAKAVKRLEYHDNYPIKNKNNKKEIRSFRKKLHNTSYLYQGNATFNELSISPLVGLGKNSILNKTIHHLIHSTKQKIILSTPYFNIPNKLTHSLIYLLKMGKHIEIIVGDKIANDFYVDEHQPFKLISIIPYLYEVNLRYFLKKLQKYIDNKQLAINLWKEKNNGYHIKGIWIDEEWQLLTGNNLNLRALKFDLENALLIHDPNKILLDQKNKELNIIRTNTTPILHYTSLQHISEYPKKIKKLIYKIRKTRLDLLINLVL